MSGATYGSDLYPISLHAFHRMQRSFQQLLNGYFHLEPSEAKEDEPKMVTGWLSSMPDLSGLRSSLDRSGRRQARFTFTHHLVTWLVEERHIPLSFETPNVSGVTAYIALPDHPYPHTAVLSLDDPMHSFQKVMALFMARDFLKKHHELLCVEGGVVLGAGTFAPLFKEYELACLDLISQLPPVLQSILQSIAPPTSRVTRAQLEGVDCQKASAALAKACRAGYDTLEAYVSAQVETDPSALTVPLKALDLPREFLDGEALSDNEMAVNPFYNAAIVDSLKFRPAGSSEATCLS